MIAGIERNTAERVLTNSSPSIRDRGGELGKEFFILRD
jgi:hypothetical protein